MQCDGVAMALPEQQAADKRRRSSASNASRRRHRLASSARAGCVRRMRAEATDRQLVAGCSRICKRRTTLPVNRLCYSGIRRCCWRRRWPCIRPAVATYAASTSCCIHTPLPAPQCSSQSLCRPPAPWIARERCDPPDVSNLPKSTLWLGRCTVLMAASVRARASQARPHKKQ